MQLQLVVHWLFDCRELSEPRSLCDHVMQLTV